MTISRAFIITFAVLALLLTALVIVMWLSGQANKELAEVEARRYESFKLADELRQSSDDLTRMARTYAATGNTTYRDYFQEILGIRNGTRPLPEDYDRAYWDLVDVNGKVPTATGKPASLLERMRAMQFTSGEFAILKVAQEKSDQLAKLENRAMFAMSGKFEDDAGNYTVSKPADPELARQLLHSKAYHDAKAGIMGDINHFFDEVESRTQREVDVARAKENRYRAFAWPLGLLAIAVSLLSYFFLGRNAVNPIRDLSVHAAALSEGKYRQHVVERGFREIGELSNTFNHMSDAIVHDIEQRDIVQKELKATRNAAINAYAKVKEDLDAAARIQQSLLPSRMPESPGIEFTYAYVPCDELAGDTLNVFRLDDRHIGLYMIDVSGHGVQAALLASTLSHMLIPVKTADSVLWEAGSTNRIASPATMAALLNSRFPMNSETNQYFTIHYGILDTHRLEYTFISAGHPGPMYVSHDNHQEILRARGAGIGILENPVFEQKKVKLSPGERLIFFSDGILEARNETGEEFQDEQLFACIRASAEMTMKECMEHLIKSVDAWSHGQQEDDVSALMMQINPE